MKKLLWLLVLALLLILVACALSISSARAHAQSVTTVENYGIALATTAAQGLGTNITPTNAWEFAAAQAAGITVARFDCGWTSVELQNLPANTSGGYTWPSTCAQGLTNAATYGLHPVIDALYGAPYGSIITGTTASDSPSGSTTISVTVATGSFSSIVNGQTYLYPSGGNFHGAKNSYPGILITGNNGSSTITLASALKSDMPSGTSITLNLQLYPPFLMPSTQNYLTNASVVAYGNYVSYIASQINAAGLTGQVSLWNEPPWPSDSWDYGANLYDTRPTGLWQAGNNTNTGLEIPLYAANELTVPSGVTLDNGYTEKSGTNSMFWVNYYSYLNNPASTQAIFGSESFHPYGNNPEDSWWNPVCLAANATPANLNNIYAACTPVGAVQGSNYKIAVATSMTSYHSGGGLPHSITETGLQQTGAITNTQVTRFDLRQWLGFQALGITPVDFYRLYGSSQFQWCTSSTGPTCNPVYYQFQALMQDIQAINLTPPQSYSPSTMPQVSSYTGYYPLATMNFVGATSGATANSVLHFVYQRTYGATWTSVTSPPAVAVTETVPSGMAVRTIKDLVTGSAISFTTAGSGSSLTYTYQVADDPIEVLLVPACNVSAGSSWGTISGIITSCASGSTVQFAPGTYTGVNSSVTVPCGVSLSGPVVAYSHAHYQTAILQESGGITQPIRTTPGCAASQSISYLEWNGEQSSGGGGFIYVTAGTQNLTINNNFAHGSGGALGSYPGCCSEVQILFAGSASAATTQNDVVTMNEFGPESGTPDCGTAMTATNTNSGGGFCAGWASEAQLLNISVDHNIFHNIEQGAKVAEACSSGCPSGPTNGNTQNLVMSYNDYSGIQRIDYETQSNYYDTAHPTTQKVQFNSLGLRNTGGGGQPNYDISSANGCGNFSGTNCGTNTDYNVDVQPSGGGAGVGLEIWGQNGTTANYNLLQGYLYNGITWAPSGQFVFNSNTMNLVSNGSGTGTCTLSNTKWFQAETNPNTPAYLPSCASNNLSNAITGTYASATPTISPATTSFTGTITVTLTNTGANRDQNTSIWYTLDGSTPTPGVSALYTGPFTLAATTTVNAVGMWGAVNQPYAYPANYGYVPSAKVSATYTLGSGSSPAPSGVSVIVISDASAGQDGLEKAPEIFERIR